MKIGVVSLGMSRQPLEEVLAVARAVGAEALEVNGRESVHGGLWVPPIDYRSIRRSLAGAGVEATSLGGYSDFTLPSDEALADEVKAFVGYCDIARQMEIPVVRAFAGDVREGLTLDAAYPRMVKGFKAVVEAIDGWGVRVGVENHGRLINHGDWLGSLLRDVGSPLVGMTLDTGNFCWAGHSLDEAHRFLEELAPSAVSVHVKDGRFFDGEFRFLPAGRGDLDLPGVFRRLRDLGYTGAVDSEYEGEGDYYQGTLESVAYLRGLRDAVE